MIEVEKKFTLTEEEKKKLLDGAEFVGKKIFTDTYYDTSDWRLTLRDIWFRSRGEKFELKVPLNQTGHDRVSDQYRELETDEEIAHHLDLPVSNSPLAKIIEDAGYKPFCTLTTTREKYKKGRYAIDLDTVDFGYVVSEIELMVSDESGMDRATMDILQFAKDHGITPGKVRGKVAEFLRRNSASHFEALRAAGVVA